jgi:hypothetical protein
MRTSLLFAGLLLSLAGMTSAAAAEDDAAANARARMEAAQKVYKGLLARWAIDPNLQPAVYEHLYRWSCRWMEAQAESGTKKDRLTAAEAHLARMRDLEKTARKLLKEGLGAPYEVSAIEFYRLDAEKRLQTIRKK